MGDAMVINWDELKKVLSPIKDYDDLCRRLGDSFSYPLVCQTFNFTLPELVSYTQRLLGGDSRGRYTEYAAKLIRILAELQHAGVQDVVDLKSRVTNRGQFEKFTQQSGISPYDIATVMKYLIYWFIPPEKYLGGLVRNDPSISDAIKVLAGLGIRTNLQLLQTGITSAGRKSLVDSTRLPEHAISDVVNRSDFSR